MKTIRIYDTLTKALTTIGAITVFILCFSDQWYGWAARIYLGALFILFLLNQDTIEARDYEKMGALEQFEYIMRKNRQ